jgi:hypothetical protein
LIFACLSLNKNSLCWATCFFNSAMVVFAEIFTEKKIKFYYSATMTIYIINSCDDTISTSFENFKLKESIEKWRFQIGNFYLKTVALSFCRHFLRYDSKQMNSKFWQWLITWTYWIDLHYLFNKWILHIFILFSQY